MLSLYMEKRNKKTKEIKLTNIEQLPDSSEIPDNEADDATCNIDDIDKIEDDAKEEYVKTVVMDRIIKYIKLDDIIKEKEAEFRSEIKELKQGKIKLEEFIISYLDKINEDFVLVGKQNRLTKQVKENRAPIKIEGVADALRDELKRQNVDEKEITTRVEMFIKDIETRRKITVKKILRRTNPEKERPKKKGLLLVTTKLDISL